MRETQSGRERCQSNVWPRSNMLCFCAKATRESETENVKVPRTACREDHLREFSGVSWLKFWSIVVLSRGFERCFGSVATP